MEVIIVASFVPRKCGIATYTRDLCEELSKNNTVHIVAMENDDTDFIYAPIVIDTIKQNNKSNYVQIAKKINESTTDIVHIQHEFGLFGGQDGDYILDFANALNKKIVSTFHTVLVTPSDHQKYILQELGRISAKIIVMDTIAKERLLSVYGIHAQKVQIIRHGVADVDKISKTQAREKLHFDNHFVVLASNLISRNKGLEYIIKALPLVKQKIPQIRFLVLGETHPLVKKSEGESYREFLINLAKELHVEEQVVFDNTYVPLSSLKYFFVASDVCITPYLDPQQITSGTLSYAIGAGKACISTPYIYARNMLAKKRGMIVPFCDERAIAHAIIYLYENPDERKEMEKKTFTLGLEMRWQQVAKNHLQLYEKVINREKMIIKEIKKYIKNPSNIEHIMTLTDATGLLQHTYYLIPDGRHGYSTDDNARALLVISAMYKQNQSEELLTLLRKYISFLLLAQETNGRFHTFLGFHRNWVDGDDVADPYGKAMWALGYHVWKCPLSPFVRSVDMMFQKSMGQLPALNNLRTIAYALFGLYYYIKAFEGEKDSVFSAKEYMVLLADRLVSFYEQTKTPSWQWFEEKMTYDNFCIPGSLFTAYLITGKEIYHDVAVQAMTFLTKANMDAGKNYFDFIGQNGWYHKEAEKALYDQQPIEAGGAVHAYVLAYKATKEKKYHKLANLAFSWFFGNNRNLVSLIDGVSNGIYDGLTPSGLNENEGAESIVCFLVALHALREITKE